MAKHRPTNDNLETIAAPLIARWLIDAAEHRTDITYGEAKRRLETEHRFSSIGRATRLGFPAGMLMHKIQSVNPDAPLLNVLLVLQADRMPSTGAGSFMASRFNLPALEPATSRKRRPKLWRETFEKAASEVYEYQDWPNLFERAFGGKYVPPASQLSPRDDNRREQDGIPFGRGGEGKRHKALRMWVHGHYASLFPRLANVKAETEVTIDSGDRVDVIYYAEERTIALEVKSRDSNEADLHRGGYQCVKYRAVLSAMDPRVEKRVASVLVTEGPLPGYLSDLARKLDIAHKRVKIS